MWNCVSNPFTDDDGNTVCAAGLDSVILRTSCLTTLSASARKMACECGISIYVSVLYFKANDQNPPFRPTVVFLGITIDADDRLDLRQNRVPGGRLIRHRCIIRACAGETYRGRNRNVPKLIKHGSMGWGVHASVGISKKVVGV